MMPPGQSDGQTLPVDVTLENRALRFVLCRRKLSMGRAGELDYLWMDSRSFRGGPGMTNLNSCLDLAWEYIRRRGRDELDSQVELALAEFYPLVNKSKGMQDVFLDAHLSPKAERDVELTDREQGTIRRLVERRDPESVRRKLGQLLAGQEPSKAVKPGYNEAFHRWMCNALVALRRGGRPGLQQFVAGEMATWIGLYRRRGGQPAPRLFINLLAHSAKASFYSCYDLAWRALLPTLTQRLGLSPASQRFLKLWHLNSGEAAERDMFCCQTLALHPLSAFVMGREEHRVAVGDWLALARPENCEAWSPDWECPEYRGMLMAVLTAAAQYKHVWEREQLRRSPSGRSRASRAAKAEGGRRTPGNGASVRVGLNLGWRF